VPLWFLFANQVTIDGPPVEFELRRCPKLIPSVMGQDLTGPLALTAPWPARGRTEASLKTGNVTWRVAGEVDIFTWGLYLWGARTDVTLACPTNICELMLFEGRAALVGTPGSYDAITPATTIEVGRPGDAAGRAELRLENVSIGHPGRGQAIRGQITAHGRSRVDIRHARCNDLLLITKDEGTIHAAGLDRVGRLDTLGRHGTIVVEDAASRAP
jgi:hypothetical protein